MIEIQDVTHVFRGAVWGPGGTRGVSSLADYRGYWAWHLHRTGKEQRPPEPTPLAAAINVRRLAAKCPCGSRVALHPVWQWAGCLACGRQWTAVVMPSAEELEAIDVVLAVRPVRHAHAISHRFYSWEPGESLGEMVRQNRRITAALGGV